MGKEQSSFEKKLIRIKESGFWDAFRFTKNGRFKSTLLIYSFSLSFVFVAVYIAAYWLLIDPLELGLRPYLSTRLLTAVESIVPALVGSLVCCVFHFTSHDKKMVLFTYGWIVLYAVVLQTGTSISPHWHMRVGTSGLRIYVPLDRIFVENTKTPSANMQIILRTHILAYSHSERKNLGGDTSKAFGGKWTSWPTSY